MMINALRIFAARYVGRGSLRNLIAVFAVVLLGLVTHSTVAAVRGGIIINIEDGSLHKCINVSNNLVSITLVEAQLQRSQAWWQAFLLSKTALGVKWDVIIQDVSGKQFDFPRAKILSVSTTRSDIGLLPMVLPIMSKYQLAGSDAVAFSNVSLDLYLVNVDKDLSLSKTF